MNQRAISFTAFCTVGQKRSERVEQHIRAAQVWCERNGYALELYAEPTDGTPELPQASPCLGGLYLVQYRLGKGLIKPGTALILESLDGVPRGELTKATTLLKELIQGGLTVINLHDLKVWDAQALAGLGGFMMSLMTLYQDSADTGPGLGGEGA